MNCKQGTEIILTQITELLERLNDESYSQSLPIFNGSSIGQHFRHILDFYICLLNGLESGLIDYALRERDVLIETQSMTAKAAFEKIQNAICFCEETESIEVKADFSSEFNSTRPIISSSIARELMYAYDHAVHHLAMIKMGIKVSFPEVKVSEKIGVAPSTLKHWKQEN